MPGGASDLGVIFFDIDDTLYSSTTFAWRAREQAVCAMVDRGLKVAEETAMAELREVVAEFGSNDDRHFNRLLERFPAEATAGVNPALLVMAGVIAYHETKWRELTIRAQDRTLLADLRRADMPLGVITAGLTAKQMEKILRLGLDAFLDPGLLFITDQVGISKASPKLYLRAAETAGVEPGRSMHVGDHPLHDVDPAAEAGMVTVLHRGSGKYAHLQGRHQPNHCIDDFGELRGLLREHYGLPL